MMHFLRTALFFLVYVFTRLASSQEMPIRYRILEEQPIGTVVADIPRDSGLATRYTPRQLSALTFKFLKPRQDFSVNLRTGVITIASVLDRDAVCPGKAECVIEVDVTVIDQQQYVRHLIKVIFQILDINDNAPTFPKNHNTESISEATLPGLLFPIQQAEDLDSPAHGVVRYQLSPESGTFELRVDSREPGFFDLHLVLLERLDRERQDMYQLTIIAYDGGNPPKSGSAMYHIEILDVNDNVPMFVNATYEVEVEENAPPQRSLITVRATDADNGRNGAVSYAFSQRTSDLYKDRFSVDRSTGQISSLKSLDYEQTGSIALEVVATDGGEGSIPVTARVLITVRDVNDNDPEIRVETTDALQSGTGINPTVYVMEHCSVGTFVAQLSVADADGGSNGRVHCSLHSPQFHLVALYDNEYKVNIEYLSILFLPHCAAPV